MLQYRRPNAHFASQDYANILDVSENCPRNVRTVHPSGGDARLPPSPPAPSSLGSNLSQPAAPMAVWPWGIIMLAEFLVANTASGCRLRGKEGGAVVGQHEYCYETDWFETQYEY